MTKNISKRTKNSVTTSLEVIYTLFISILIVLFFSLGIAAFYTEPQYPEYPERMMTIYNDAQGKELTDVEKQEISTLQKELDEKSEEYENQISVYNRNVSIITLALAVFALAISLLFLENIKILSNGLMLGGVFTLIYSMIRGFMVDNIKITFAIVSVGLAVSIFLGYIKFIKQRK
jgi:hypothetical protein